MKLPLHSLKIHSQFGATYIYGIYSEAGECLYIGSSAAPWKRWEQHRISARFKDTVIHAAILRSNIPAWKTPLLEGQIIRAYKRRGQANLNIAIRPTAHWRHRSKELFAP